MLRRLGILIALSALAAAAMAQHAAADTLQADCTNFGTTLGSAGAGDTIVLTGLCSDQSHTLPATANLTIEGAATGTNGFDGAGAGAPALNGTLVNGLTVRNLTFENYAATALSVSAGAVTNQFSFIGDTFSNNHSITTNGGGLRLEAHNFTSCTAAPNITLSGSTFTNNSTVGNGTFPTGAEGGGGGAFLDLECTGGSAAMTVTGNTFTGNSVSAVGTASRQGGGLWVGLGRYETAVPIALTQSGNKFTGNSVTGGGGSYAGGGEFTVGANVNGTGDSFIGNSLPGSTASGLSSEGGGLSTRSGGNCTGLTTGANSMLTNLVAAGNTIGAPSGTGTGGEGAGIYAGCSIGLGGYHLALSGSTVSGNQATGAAAVAGIDGEATDFLVLQNTIAIGNQGGADVDGFGASPGANVTAASSDVCAIGALAPFAGTANICADPALVNAAGGDVHQTSASPTIDAGSNGFVSTATDIYGAPRIVSGKPGDAAIVDIGAAEAPSDSFTVGKLKGRTLFVDVSSAGRVDLTRGDVGGYYAATQSKSKKLLNSSSASGGPGTLAVPVLLTKKARKQLKAKGKLKLKARVTFTPTGGVANTKSLALKLKKKKKKK